MTKDTKKPASGGRSLAEAARAVLTEAQNLGPKVAYSEPSQKLNPTDGPARGAIQDLRHTDNEGATGQNTTAGAPAQKLSPNGDQGAVQDLGHSLTTGDAQPGENTRKASGSSVTPSMRANDRLSRTNKVPGGRYPEQESYNPTNKKLTTPGQPSDYTDGNEYSTFTQDDIKEDEFVEDDEYVYEEDEIAEEDDDDDKKGNNPFAKKASSDDDDSDSDDDDDNDDDHKEPDGDECKKEDLIPEEVIDDAIAEANIPDHMAAMFANGGKNLSEEFKVRASTVFEAAIREVSAHMFERLNAHAVSALSEAIETYQESLTEQVDSYLGYVVEQWVAENEVAIESGLRSELTEDFIRGLHTLFVENHIDVPVEKVDVIEELSAKIDELESKLDEEFQYNVALRDELIEARKVEVFNDVTRGMTDVQVDKLAGLAEGIATDDPTEFQEKLQTLKESYMTPGSKAVSGNRSGLDSVEPSMTKDAKTGQTLTETVETVLSPRMQHYSDTLGRQVKSPTYTGN